MRGGTGGLRHAVPGARNHASRLLCCALPLESLLLAVEERFIDVKLPLQGLGVENPRPRTLPVLGVGYCAGSAGCGTSMFSCTRRGSGSTGSASSFDCAAG